MLDSILTIAHLERKNKRTKTLTTDPSMCWAQIAAATFNRELVENAAQVKDMVAGTFAALADEEAGQPVEQQLVLAEQPLTRPELAKPARGKSALELFKDAEVARFKTEGIAMNRLAWSREWRAETMDKFKALPTDERDAYKVHSSASKANARASRDHWRLEVRAAQALLGREAPSALPLVAARSPRGGARQYGTLPLPVDDAQCAPIVCGAHEASMAALLDVRYRRRCASEHYHRRPGLG